MSNFSDDEAFVTAVLDDPWPVLAPAVFGVSLDLFVLGVLLCQFTYWKMRLEADEKRGIRFLVYWINLGSVAHSGLCQAWAMDIFVGGYGNPLRIVHGWWIKGDCVFEILLAMPVEAFYATRAYHLWGGPRVMLFTLPWLFMGFIALGTANIVISPSNIINPTTDPIAIGWMGCIALLDWILTILIVMGLMRKRSGFKSTDRLVMKLVALSAEAQLVPSLVTAGMMVKAFVWPRSTIILMFMTVPKIWVFTAMLVINFRRRLQMQVENERQLRQNTFNLLPPSLSPVTGGGRSTDPLGQPGLPALSVPSLAYLSRPAGPSHLDSASSAKDLIAASVARSTASQRSSYVGFKEDEEVNLRGLELTSFPDSLAQTLTLVGSDCSAPTTANTTAPASNPVALQQISSRPELLHHRSQSSPHLSSMGRGSTSPVSPFGSLFGRGRPRQPSQVDTEDDEGEDVSFEQMLGMRGA